MVKLYIDGVECIPAPGIKIGAGAGKRDDVPVELPSTPVNRKAVGDVDGMLCRDRFNDAARRARLEEDGCTVAEGLALLTGIVRDPSGERIYRMVIKPGAESWEKRLAATPFAQTGVAFDRVLGAQAISDSWTWDNPVRFFPVQRGGAMAAVESGSATPAAGTLTVDDYHPFLHVQSVLEAAARQAGYLLRSDFAGTALFRSLYMSGRYASPEVSALKEKMDFRAGRFADRTATANRYGMVSADPFNTTASSVGNIVDTADPAATQDGAKADGVYDRGGTFSKTGGRVAFTPSKEVTAGFEFNLRYKTSYRILSRTELSGFNTVSLCDGSLHTFRIPNRFADMRLKVVSGKQHMLVVFDHIPGTFYLLRYDRVVNPAADISDLQPSDVQNVTHATFSTRVLYTAINSTDPIANLTVWAMSPGAQSYTVYGGDWAFYEGYVGETGVAEVDVKLKSAPVTVTPSSPQFFDTVYFSGAPEGASFTLCRQTYIKPVFSQSPVEGSRLRFADVAAHKFSQLDFVEAVCHMFNLRITADEDVGELFIEPESVPTGVETDWTALTDHSGPMLIEETAGGFDSVMQVAYRRGDDSVALYEAECGSEMGLCEWNIPGMLAGSGTRTLRNGIFTPSVNLAGGYAGAPAALLLQAGKRDDDGQGDGQDAFLPKIVRYMGMASLPPGQEWGWPSYGGRYPFIAFHHGGNASSGAPAAYGDDPAALVENGFTLCFEDRDGVEGLHRFYDPMFERAARGRRITLRIRLSARHIEALLFPADGRCANRFRIDAGGEEALCRLERIEGYAPASGESCECTLSLL